MTQRCHAMGHRARHSRKLWPWDSSLSPSFRQRAREAASHAEIVRGTLADATSTTLQHVEDGGAVKSDDERVI